MKINLLIVDDIEANLYALEILFEKLEIENKDFEGLNIFTALDGKEALRITLKEKIDLILLDVRMPEMDGFEVAKFLKSSKKTSHIPIVFLTAEFKSEEFINKGYKLGALDYFIKPIEEFQFLNKMSLYINLFLAQKIQQKEFDDTLSEYRKLMDNHIISSDTDIDGKIIHVSQAFCDITGYSKQELMGKTHDLLRAPDVKDDIYKELWETISQNKIWQGEIRNKSKSGEEYWIESIISPVYDKDRKKIGYTSVEHDITYKKKLEYLSITDGLTGLFNRRYFDKITEDILNRSKRNNELLCCALIDIDHFKFYNDTYGHQMGDEVLKKVSNVFSSSTKRADDYCFRIGGEEFCIIFNAIDKANALDFIEQIKEKVENLKIPHAKNSASPYITISIGFTCAKGSDIKSQQDLLKQTDELLYKAKEAGRNKVVAKTDRP